MPVCHLEHGVGHPHRLTPNAEIAQQTSASNAASGTQLNEVQHHQESDVGCIYSITGFLSNQVLMLCCKNCWDEESMEPQKHQPSHNWILELVISLFYQL